MRIMRSYMIYTKKWKIRREGQIKMKKEIVFIDEETLTKDELQNAETLEQTENRMKTYYDKMEGMNGKTEE